MGTFRKTKLSMFAACAGMLISGQALASGPVEDFEASDGSVTPNQDFAVKVKVLGAEVGTSSYDAMVTASVMVDDERNDVYGDMSQPASSNVNDGEQHEHLMTARFGAGTELRIAATSWVKTSSSNSGSSDSHWKEHMTVIGGSNTSNVIVLRDGDDVPNITPLRNQATINSFLADYIDTDTDKVVLDDNQAIYLFELGTSNLSSSAADFQDLVVLVTLAEDHSFYPEYREIKMPDVSGNFD